MGAAQSLGTQVGARSVSLPVGVLTRSRYYSLEVVQHPLRARMCGFGDKVRPYAWITVYV